MFWKVYLGVMSSHWMNTPGLIYERESENHLDASLFPNGIVCKGTI